MAAVLAKIKGAGLPADAIRTSGYDLQPEFDYNNGKQTLRGYVARNTVEVRVDDIGRVGEILDLAVGVRRHERERRPLRFEGSRRGGTGGAAEGRGRRAHARRSRRVRREPASGPGPADRGTARRRRTATADDDDAAVGRRDGVPAADLPGELEVRAVVTMTSAIGDLR